MRRLLPMLALFLIPLSCDQNQGRGVSAKVPDDNIAVHFSPNVAMDG